MNYPIWDLPGAGLLIASVAIVHVFISHFAIGGGLFLVLTETMARRRNDTALLGYLEVHSRFFILVTLVLGALTGVGIWFTIGLVNPSATSSLINTFLWAWAIEWVLFATEIAAALVYYYGWRRLAPRTHLAVGWIYFVTAWLSLAVINGILSFMLTPGQWLSTRGFWDGLFNPTYLPSLAARTALAVGLAGLYALLTVSWSNDRALRQRVGRYAGLYWVMPMAAALPIALAWYLSAAMSAGVPVGAMLGARAETLGAVAAAVFSGPGDSGYPAAQRAALVTIVASALLFLLTLSIVVWRSDRFGRITTAALMLLGLAAMGGGEWVREDLRKPYVIGQFMFVNGVRLPQPREAPPLPRGFEDRFSIEALQRTGVIESSQWVRTRSGPPDIDRSPEIGAEVFRLACSTCHTIDGYQAIRPLVRGKSVQAIDSLVERLAQPVDAGGHPAAWSDSGLRLTTWRGRHMPPFPGTDDERRALAAFLALIGGTADEELHAAPSGPQGAQIFDERCSACHGTGSPWPVGPALLRGRTAGALYELIGRLPEVNDMMPPFDGTDEERRALADYLAGMEAAADREDRP
jgi:mono/diheme cytochrome c family protein